jgi:hypothetical protein
MRADNPWDLEQHERRRQAAAAALPAPAPAAPPACGTCGTCGGLGWINLLQRRGYELKFTACPCPACRPGAAPPPPRRLP